MAAMQLRKGVEKKWEKRKQLRFHPRSTESARYATVDSLAILFKWHVNAALIKMNQGTILLAIGIFFSSRTIAMQLA